MTASGKREPCITSPDNCPTNPIPASLGSPAATVFPSPNRFRGSPWPGQSSGRDVFLQIRSGQGGRKQSIVIHVSAELDGQRLGKVATAAGQISRGNNGSGSTD
jgi:hypothetical protein